MRRTQAALAALDEVSATLSLRLAQLEVELDVFERLELDAFEARCAVVSDLGMSSVLKLVGSELHQKIAELAVEIMGDHARPTLDAIGISEGIKAGGRAMAKHLAVRAATIYSGTSETQRNVIARQLGLTS